MSRNGVERNSNTCVQVQLHAIAQAQGRWNSFPRIWLHDNIPLMQFKSKKDWTGDNSCPFEVRSKYYVCVNDICHTIYKIKKIQYLSKGKIRGEMDTILN